MGIYRKQVSVGQFAKKGEDFKEGDTLVIANEGKPIEGQFGVQDVFLVKLPNGEEKNLSFNQTSINNIVDAYGEDSTKWIGKPVKVWMIRQSVSGKLVKVTYLAHPDAELLDDPIGALVWQIPHGLRGATTVVATPKPLVKPVDYPQEDINPDDIPF